ncbi:hypothetical protein NYG95_06250 [Campylobacter felis]|uniref:RelA/SpoT domain-containing protein n=1 Tax=Campylobacter felis TaxID=2974565 RepID=A0ABT7I535_9BACT|nr:hypothetical protein [Campylobacter felis]MDL0109452.1 hypothetical protein [Campylobacter felis]MDL0147208.1 hypothetical protein [Campylobacter felis]
MIKDFNLEVTPEEPLKDIIKFNSKEVLEQYKKDVSIYKSFESILRAYIDALIDKAVKEGKLDKNVAETQSRTKTPESFEGKINRDDKRLKYSNPLKEVTDLVGVKILLTSIKDSQIVYEILRAELREQIDEENSIDKTQELREQRKFGYLGKHLVISYSPKMLNVVSKQDLDINEEKLEGLKAEIQIKTLLQHVWAEVEHKARYKAGEELSADKKRYFDRLAALIEVADDLFKDLIDESERINQEAQAIITQEQEKSQFFEKNENQSLEKKEKIKSVSLDSTTVLLFLKNERVKEKFKKLENIDLMILCDEEPISVSAKFIQLLHCVKLDYTKDLNLLLEDKSLREILHRYAAYRDKYKTGKSILQKLNVLQILIYAKANKEQKEEIKSKKLIHERMMQILDSEDTK